MSKTALAVDPRFFRPAEVDNLIGDARLAEQRLGWKPKTTFEQLVIMMAEADDRRVRDLGPSLQN